MLCIIIQFGFLVRRPTVTLTRLVTPPVPVLDDVVFAEKLETIYKVGIFDFRHQIKSFINVKI